MPRRAPSAASVVAQRESPRLPVGASPVRGPRDAPVTLVEFSDFACPYCSRLQAVLRRVRARYADRVRIVYKHMPLAGHRLALPAARVSVQVHSQLGEDAFWQFHDGLFGYGPMFQREDVDELARSLGLADSALAAAHDGSAPDLANVDDDRVLAERLEVHGLPTVFVNGSRIEGARPYAEYAAAIDRALANAQRVTPPEDAYRQGVEAAMTSVPPAP